MRPLSPRRRRVVALSVIPACLSGGLGLLHQHFAGRAHEALFVWSYLALMCVPLGLAIRETIKLRQEEGCRRV